jgi:recombinational DNA repair protein (RecF pathway)
MKKIKRNRNYKNHATCKCAICGRDASDSGIGSPFGTFVCLECAHVIHQMVEQATRENMTNALFMQKVPKTNQPNFYPVLPLFAE